MADKTVSFSYTVGTARFNTSLEVDKSEWNNSDDDDRMEMLRDHALDDIEEYLEIEKDSLQDEE